MYSGDYPQVTINVSNVLTKIIATMIELLSMIELEQLERLRSEDTPRLPMITHTIDQSFESQVHTIDQFISDPKSKQGESRKIRKICEKLKF